MAVLILNREILGSSLGPRAGYPTNFSVCNFFTSYNTVSFTSFPLYKLLCFSVLCALPTDNDFKQSKIKHAVCETRETKHVRVT